MLVFIKTIVNTKSVPYSKSLGCMISVMSGCLTNVAHVLGHVVANTLKTLVNKLKSTRKQMLPHHISMPD